MDDYFSEGSNQGDGCDESLCISTGSTSEFHGSSSSSFTCYGEEENGSGSGVDGIVYPMMCADGYLPQVVEDEPPVTKTNGDDVHLLRYFTCCPPDHHQTNGSDVTRHCSHPIDSETDDDGDGKTIDPTVCEGHDIWNYPRPMKIRGSYDSYGFVMSTTNSFVCCDSKLSVGDGYGDIENEEEGYGDIENENATATTSFLDDLECVPFCDKFHKECKIENRIGATWLNQIRCSVPEEDFRFARPLEEGINILSIRRYQCCKTGPALPLFLHNSSFQIEVYTLLAMFIVAAIASAVVVIGLLVPLLIQLKKGIYQRRSSMQIRRGETRFSSYNLYLVYLASPDLLYSIFSIWRLLCIINQINPVTFSVFYSIPYGWVIANLWINSIMCYEVLLLLKSRERAQRIEPPSLTRVTFQSFAAYFLSAILLVIFYFLYEAFEEAINNENAKESQTIFNVIYCFVFLGIFLPIGYVTYVFIVVWYRGYIPPINGTTPNERAMRELARYFFRIVGVFFGIWLPCVVFQLYADASGLAWPAFASAVVTAFQPIATSYVIAIKSDARKYIVDLLTLSYIFGDRRICGVRGIKKTTWNRKTPSYGGNASNTEPSYGGNASQIQVAP